MKNNKRVGLSVVIIMAVAAAAVGGTYAYFTAQRSAAQNKFTAGTLDMSVTGDNNTANEPFVVDNIGQNGDIAGAKTWTVKNTGTMPGRLLLKLAGIANEENGCNDQEKAVESDCDAPGNEGDMGKVIQVHVALDGGEIASSYLTGAEENKIGDTWNAAPSVIINPGEQKTVSLSWNTPASAYGNEIQSDSVKFDTLFRLVQLTK